jgi:hypothetical protein
MVNLLCCSSNPDVRSGQDFGVGDVLLVAAIVERLESGKHEGTAI